MIGRTNERARTPLARGVCPGSGWALALIGAALLFPPVVQAQLPGTEVRDSAGVRIVENPDPATTEVPRWRVPEVPELRLGMLDGPEHLLFSGVLHGAVLESGEIAVSTREPVQLRVFDREGRHLRSFGASGEGPGEFRSGIGGLLPLGGSTVGLSNGSMHLHIYDASDGSHLRSIRGPYAHGIMMTGQWIGEDRLFARSSAPDADPVELGAGVAGRVEGAFMPATVLMLWDPVSLGLDTLGVMGGIEQYQSPSPGVPVAIPATPVPLGRRGHVASGADRIHAGNTGRYEIRVFDWTGDLVQVIRRAHTPRPVSNEDRARARERLLEGPLFDLEVVPPDIRRALERQAREAPMPDTHPVFEAFFVARTGELWVRLASGAEDTTWRFDVFSPAGELEAVVEMPRLHRVLDIGEDHVLGVARDAFDVEYVELYRIMR